MAFNTVTCTFTATRYTNTTRTSLTLGYTFNIYGAPTYKNLSKIRCSSYIQISSYFYKKILCSKLNKLGLTNSSVSMSDSYTFNQAGRQCVQAWLQNTLNIRNFCIDVSYSTHFSFTCFIISHLSRFRL